MNPATSLIGQAQAQAEQNIANSPLGIMPSTGSTAEQALQSSPNQGSVVPSGGNQPSLLQRLLPTLGGIGGGILGEVVDPFGGGVAGAVLGAGLAGAGSAAGKAAENATEGKNVGNGVLTSGLEGAAGQGLAEGAGAALGAGGKAIEGAANRMGEGAAQSAAQDAAAQTYKNIPKGLRQAHDLQGSLDLANQVGADATNPQNLIDTGSQANDVLDNSVNDALGQAGPVDASDYNDIVKNAIAQRSGVLGSYEPMALGRGRLGPGNTPAAKLLSQLQDYGAGVAKANADPTAIRQLMQQVGKAYGDADPSVTALTGAKDPVQVATHDALGDVYNGLKDKLFNRPEVNDNFSKLEGNLMPDDVDGNAQLAGHLNNILNNATTAQPVLDSLKQFGNLRNIGHDATTAEQGIVQPAAGRGLSTGNVVDLGGAAEAVLGHNPGIGIVGPLAYHALQNPAVVGGVGRAAQGVADSGLGQAALTGAGETVANSPNDVAGNAGGSNGIVSSAMNTGSNPYNLAIESALLNGNSGSLDSLLGGQQKLNAATAAEQNLAQIYNAGGGAQGPLGGRLGILGSWFTGGEQGSYNSQAMADAEAIAQATGQTPQAVQAELPKITQDQSAAQASLGNIQSLIQALQSGQIPQGLVGAASR